MVSRRVATTLQPFIVNPAFESSARRIESVIQRHLSDIHWPTKKKKKY